MFDMFAKMVTRWWWAVILFWVAITAGVKLVAPNWDDITNDGDLAYLPETLPSYVGEKLLEKAFPQDRAKSQMAVVIARNDDPLETNDLDVANDVARRFKNFQGITAFERAKRSREEAQRLRAEGSSVAADRAEARAAAALEEAEFAFDDAISLDALLFKHFNSRLEEAGAAGQKNVAKPERLASAFWNRARLNAYLDRPEDAAHDRAQAIAYDASLQDHADEPIPAVANSLPILDVLTWNDDVLGSKLGAKHKHARLVVLQLENEFMATDNIRVLEEVESELKPVRKFAAALGATQSDDPAQGLQLGISGSAAVGGDMLRSAQESIKHTELFTVIIVVLILAAVYRSPLLVFVPLVTIFVSLQLSMGVIALLTQLGGVPGFSWWDLKVFTTTKIFIVVILFGAGTDFCLFLISRFKEELEHGHPLAAANQKSLAAVADALIASAMTTILGLAMMFFADFGKYTYSGPVIGLCLFVTLLACLTLAPALLRACGSWLFWPMKISKRHVDHPDSFFDRFWQRTARWIVSYPVPILVGSVLILFPAAWHGWQSGDHVTYDFLSGLDDHSPSKIGTNLLTKHFPIGESSPIVVVANRAGSDWVNTEKRDELKALAKELKIDGVTAVRNVTNPLGEERKRTGIFGIAKRSATAANRRGTDTYVSQAPGMAGDVTKFELILATDPFDVQSLQVLAAVDAKLAKIQSQPQSYWKDATFAYAGATAGVRDLRDVTRNDNRRIQFLVVIAVFLVLVAVLRKPLVCAYMIISVLFSYYVTIGSTEAFFTWIYGASYPGMDWKVPLFLFVILVAVGEDYNVYLATRVYEEQKRHGLFSGLRKAIVKTGGIITSCGVIMAGTFVSMTSGTWGAVLPTEVAEWLFPGGIGALRGIVELGFALTLGVLLDTFIVRPILVPAFMALLAQIQARRPRVDRPRQKLVRGPHKPRVAAVEETIER